MTKRETLHDARERDRPDLNDQVDVIVHQAKGMHPMTEALNTFLHEKVKVSAILSVNKYVCTAIAAQHDIVDGTGIMDAGFTGHFGSLTEKSKLAMLQA